MMDKAIELLSKVYDWLFPICPRGGHRIKIGMVTNCNGNKYCWHKDCMRENFADIEPKESGV